MKKIYVYVAFSLMATALYSCNKELSALPQNSKTEENTILDQATSQIALNGAYYNFANASATKNGWQPHQITTARLAGYMQYGYGPNGVDLNQNASGTSFWTESYKLLNAANGVIKGVTALADNKFTANRKKEILAEARFLRAYGHFRLLMFYAEWFKPNSSLGVLIRDELSTLTNISKARSSVKESYDFILADLDEAIANGPSTNAAYYATKWAAMVLKMRVLINRGAAGDFTEIISLANTITTSSPYVLEANAMDIFRSKGLSSKEVILGLQPQALQAADFYSKTKQYYPGASSLYVASNTLKSIYANDPRLTWMIGTANPSTSSPNTFYFTKYAAQGTAASSLTETDYAIRLTEVYLIKAEAIVRSGGSLTDAKTLLHTIQSKAGITATVNNINYLEVEAAGTPDAMLMEIYKETVRSMVAEDGQEWMCLLRLPLTTVQQLRPTITSQLLYIFGVPSNEFLYNPLFGDQNPGYNK